MSKLSTVTSIIRAYQNFPLWFYLYLGFGSKKEYIIKTRKGERLIVRNKERDIERIGEIYHLDDYTRIPIQGTVVDIGAHCGYFSSYAAQLADSVFAYEPVEETFKILNRNLRLNEISNVQTHKLGVSNKKGKAKIYLDDQPSSNSLFRKTDTWEEIDLVTLSDVFDDNNLVYIDYLKIDCEGAEFDILLNASKQILSKIGSIVLEYHDAEAFRKGPRRLFHLTEHLTKNGFNVRVVRNKGDDLGNLYATR